MNSIPDGAWWARSSLGAIVARGPRVAFAILGVGVISSAWPQGPVGNVFREEPFPSVTGLEPGDKFGASGASLGDLDGDGVEDFAIGAPGDDDGGQDFGAVYLLFMNADGSLKTQWKISDTYSGFGGNLRDGARLGFSMANVGDLDGDGSPELAVSAPVMNGVWIFFLRPNGTFHNVVPLATPPLSIRLGIALAGIDLDGDGRSELACSDPAACAFQGGSCVVVQAGAVHLYSLGAAGQSAVIQTITGGTAGFSDPLAALDYFGMAASAGPDLDGDGIKELFVSAPGRNGVTTEDGIAWAFFLNPDGSVRTTRAYPPSPPISLEWGAVIAGTGGSSIGSEIDVWFKDRYYLRGFALDANGSIIGGGSLNLFGADGDCGSCNERFELPHGFLLDLGVEANGVGRLLEGLPDSNRVRILVHSSPNASWSYRNGSGVNQWTLANVSQPRIGSSWDTDLNCVGHGPSVAALFFQASPGSGPLLPAGEILFDLGSPRLLKVLMPHAGTVVPFRLAIPNDPALCALRATVQGVCLGSPGSKLSNAIDIQIGL